MSALDDLGTLVDVGKGIFGSSGSQSGHTEGSGSRTVTGSARGSTVEQLQLDQAAVDQIIRDVLGGADGLSNIFAAEQAGGMFNSSVAAQAAGDLAAKLVGEIAKITGKNVTESEQEEEQQTEEEFKTHTKTRNKDDGLLGAFGL